LQSYLQSKICNHILQSKIYNHIFPYFAIIFGIQNCNPN
jgi:hypothetical protein